jgi:ubiquinone/menaquinone biosynthesis C-methylase UbiE
MAEPNSASDDRLTDRQKRELNYHKDHAHYLAKNLKLINYQILTSASRRWWNAYWDTWTFLIRQQFRGKRVLVVGCGAGEDALYFAKLGAIVSAFDLSADMLSLGIKLATRERLSVAFAQMPSERLAYPNDTFDVVFARDILHHVEISPTMLEIIRVSKSNGLFVADEIYSHSITGWVRHSWLVERLLYGAMQRFIYKGEKPYITEDERKMTERDIAQLKTYLHDIQHHKYFNFIVTRLLPDKFPMFNKLDRILMMALGPLGYFVAGRIVIAGRLQKS